jgi:steroid 5-alpha reductase family enzyme
VNPVTLALEALAALCVLFLLVYVLARVIDNFGIVDIAWSYSFIVIAVIYAALGAGWPVRRALVATMATLWALRLGTHLLVRIARKHPEEDGRYRQLRKDWGSVFMVKMAGFFQLQALSVIVLGYPFLAACSNPAIGVKPLEWAGTALWLIAISGEALSDAQLSWFKKSPLSRGKVCEVGLWRYSRHPNYFFEWLIWVSYFLFASASPWGWLSVLSPACILFLLLRVTGIPMTEEQSIRSKGDLYRRYQERTSVFIPLPPKKSRA